MSYRVRTIVMIFTFMSAAAVMHADWTAIGSTGTIDESDVAKIALNSDSSAEIRPTISSTSAKIPFNLTAVSAIEPPPPGQISGGLIFSMRFRDNGAGAHIIATLKRVALNGFSPNLAQATTTLATIDSDLEPASNTWQTAWAQHSTCCRAGQGLSFLNDGYFVEVQLIKNNSSGTPAIMGVQLIRDQP